jgi:phage replication-related protein YjqB (UPF0714/DUF867 family)
MACIAEKNTLTSTGKTLDIRFKNPCPPGREHDRNTERAMNDRYANFQELANLESRGVDYEIEHVVNDPNVLIMAPHGGKIEFFTSDLAALIADEDFSFYTFKGLKNRNNRTLHITSSRFDEPGALAAAGEAETVLAIHGSKSDHGAFAMVGGLDKSLASRIVSELEKAGFPTASPREGMKAIHPKNICNRGKTRKGAQIELSRTLREQLRENRGKRQKFVKAVRKALAEKT